MLQILKSKFSGKHLLLRKEVGLSEFVSLIKHILIQHDKFK